VGIAPHTLHWDSSFFIRDFISVQSSEIQPIAQVKHRTFRRSGGGLARNNQQNVPIFERIRNFYLYYSCVKFGFIRLRNAAAIASQKRRFEIRHFEMEIF